MFDFESFFRREGIPFITEGRNVASGNINIHCPLCGDQDPSEHLGIHLKTGSWGCWRNSDHRGKSPVRLIRALLGCSWEQAEVVAADDDIVEDQTWAELEESVLSLDQPEEGIEELKEVRLDRGVLPINELAGNARRAYRRYLAKRGFLCGVKELEDQYQLRGATFGDWKWRLILPFISDGKMVGWTGRSISKRARLKYLSYPGSSAVKQILFNEDNAVSAGGRVLVVVEGPLDCLKVDFYGQASGFRSVALLGVHPTTAQVNRLARVAPRFDDILILLDMDAVARALDLCGRLAALNPVIGILSAHNDPGDIPHDMVPHALEKCLK